MINLDKQEIVKKAVGDIVYHYSTLGLSLFWGGSSDNLHEPYSSSPIAAEIELIVDAALGGMKHTPDNTDEVIGTIQHVCEVMFSTIGSSQYQIPDHFWQSSLGQAIALAQAWARGDDLITKSEAAAILFGDNKETNLNKLNRKINAGQLREYLDAREPNPQRNRRVSRMEVEALRDEH